MGMQVSYSSLLDTDVLYWVSYLSLNVNKMAFLVDLPDSTLK